MSPVAVALCTKATEFVPKEQAPPSVRTVLSYTLELIIHISRKGRTLNSDQWADLDSSLNKANDYQLSDQRLTI